MKKSRLISFMVLLLLAFTACMPETELDPPPESLMPYSGGEAEYSGKETDVPTRGTWNNNVYTNDFFGTQFVLPENWTIIPDDKQAEKVALTIEEFGEQSAPITEAGLKTPNFPDMQAADNSKTKSVGFNIHMPGTDERTAGMTANDYAAFLQMLMNEAEDYTQFLPQVQSAKIAGQEYAMIQGMKEEANYYCFVRQKGDYFLWIGIVVDANEKDNLLNYFS